MDITTFFQENGWDIAHLEEIPARPAKYLHPENLALSAPSLRYLSQFEKGIYEHQHEALKRYLDGENVCLSTSTASGKSMVFYTAFLEALARKPASKALAVYPLKALGNEQEERWSQALKASGVKAAVGRIDGSVAMNNRESILRTCHVVAMTPDVIHAWLLHNLRKRSAINFIRNLSLVVVDEAHTYTGVFGSNAAYLFRRLDTIAQKLGSDVRYIAASATLREPDKHLANLTGKNFSIVGNEFDTSERKRSIIFMANLPPKDTLTAITDLNRFLAHQTIHKFITFVDSRKQTEQLAALAHRISDSDVESREDEEESHDEFDIEFDSLQPLQIYPYRSGYEEHDRQVIQQRLSNGDLKGVISTSALEMGIDIKDLSVAVLVGIPRSATSFFQRIGRVGRHNEGIIIIVNDGSVSAKNIFRNPNELMRMPLGESALYLENQRIQYLHVLCIARQGGELDAVNETLNVEEEKLTIPESFSPSFISLCNLERIGEIGPEFQAMKSQAGDDPNHVFPLRDIDTQFKVLYVRGPERSSKGSLSYSQVMREAYPGAVYYYQARPYRVTRVKMRDRQIEVRKERSYTTKPTFLPTTIYPNLTSGNVHAGVSFGDLMIIESNMQVRETLLGFSERRGPTKFNVPYPLDPKLGMFYDQPYFNRNFFTSGVIIRHPAFDEAQVDLRALSQILFESFLIVVPFERQDVSYGDDKYRSDRGLIREGNRFVCLYDQAYGSLRLTSRAVDAGTFHRLLEKAIDIAINDSNFEVNYETLSVLRLCLTSLDSPGRDIVISMPDEEVVDDGSEMIIMPDSVGLDLARDNEEFWVEAVIYTPRGIRYKGRHSSQRGAKFDDADIFVSAKNIVPIPSRSRLGTYDFDTGEVKPL